MPEPWTALHLSVPPTVLDDFRTLTEECEDPADNSVRFMFLVQRVRSL